MGSCAHMQNLYKGLSVPFYYAASNGGVNRARACGSVR